MFFGMCNSPATFQTMMNDIFEKLILQKKIIVYMDNILIFAKTCEELEEITKEVLQTLEDNDLYLKPKMDSPTVLYLITDPNLRPKHSKKCSEC